MMTALFEIDRDDLIAAAAKRLRSARVGAGYRSAAEFARAIRTNVTTYQHHENGRRGFDADDAKLYAQNLNTDPAFLLYGRKPSGAIKLQPGGIITANGVVTMDGAVVGIVSGLHDANPAADGAVDLPSFDGLHVLVVQGDSLYPAYRDGDLVFHRELMPLRHGDLSLNGAECIVHLHDGSRLLRQIMFQPDGKVALIGHGVPPQFNAVVVAAAPIEWIRRRAHRPG